VLKDDSDLDGPAHSSLIYVCVLYALSTVLQNKTVIFLIRLTWWFYRFCWLWSFEFLEVFLR